jgi:hypothetical protein
MAKRPSVPYRYGRKICIFCGAPADSEEHLWPKWAKHILPNSIGHRRWVLTGRRSTGEVTSSKGYDRQGSTSSLRLRRVCRTCNSEWMSQYEERVHFHLERLILGRRVFLNSDVRQTLAEYLTYKMLVFDWLDEDPVMPPEWAHEFYRSRTIPGQTRIWALNCIEGPWRGDFQSSAFGLAEEEDWHPELPKNAKSFSIGFGDLFVFATFCTEVDLDLDLGPKEAAFRLWPPSDGLMIWPLRNPISSSDAAYVSGAFLRLGEHPSITAGRS